MKNYIYLIVIIFALYSCSSDDSNDINCPQVNNTHPLLLGNWIFTGTTVNGNLLIEDCDSMTTLEITCNEFKSTSFGGENCSTSNTSISNFIIEDNEVRYFDGTLGNNDFRQEIITLNTEVLVLKSVNNLNNNIITENWMRL